MIIDKLMSPTLTGTLAAFTTGAMQKIGNALDLGDARDNGLNSSAVGPGFVITLRGATTGSTSTLNLQLVTDDNDSFSTPTVLWSSSDITTASMAGLTGKQIFVPLPSATYEKYVGFMGQAVTAVFTGGTFEIEYAADFRKWTAYPAETGR